MTSGLHRFYGFDHLHFVTCSCVERRPILGSPECRDLFLSVLEDVRRRYHPVIVGYVVMPEHFHLLAGEPKRATLSTSIQALKLGFTKRLLAAVKRGEVACVEGRTRL